MAVTQIPNLPGVAAISGADLLEAVQAGTSVKVSTTQLADYTMSRFRLLPFVVTEGFEGDVIGIVEGGDLAPVQIVFEEATLDANLGTDTLVYYPAAVGAVNFPTDSLGWTIQRSRIASGDYEGNLTDFGIDSLSGQTATRVNNGGTPDDWGGWNFQDQTVTPQNFGAVMDGITDDLAAIQAAVDYSAANAVLGVFDGGTYAVSGEIVWKQGARFRGAGNWSGVSSLYETVGTTVFKYIGAGGANSCVIRVSSAAVGTEATAAGQLQNIGLTHVTVDGNGLAEFGFYFNRSWSNNQFDYLTGYNCLKHNFWAGNCWNGSPTNWHSFKATGAGITLGIDTFSWGTCTVDQSTCTSFFGYYSGHNSATVNQNAFNETTGTDLEYGIGIGNGRALVMINAQGQNCGGAGIYLGAITLNSVQFKGGYAEGNGQSSGATRAWGIWYACGTSTLNVNVDGMHLGLSAAIKVTGSPNTGRPYQALRLQNMPLLDVIDATHGYYWLINCDSVYTVVGSSPLSTLSGTTLDNTNTITVKDTLFTLQDDGDTTKQAVFQLSGITTGNTRTITVPDGSGTIAMLSTATQTFLGNVAVQGTTLNLGNSSTSSTIGLGNGATANGNTKAVNIGTAGVSGSTTTVTLGSAVAGSANVIVFNGAPQKPVFTVATLPTATAGRSAYVSDSNATLAAGLGNTVAGGGANFVPVFGDGTNWKIG